MHYSGHICIKYSEKSAYGSGQHGNKGQNMGFEENMGLTSCRQVSFEDNSEILVRRAKSSSKSSWSTSSRFVFKSEAAKQTHSSGQSSEMTLIVRALVALVVKSKHYLVKAEFTCGIIVTATRRRLHH